MRSFRYAKQTFRHGDKVTCKIDHVVIKDAKISIDDNDDVYICQNHKQGVSADDKLGYKYSWTIGYLSRLVVVGNSVTDLRLVNNDDYEIF